MKSIRFYQTAIGRVGIAAMNGAVTDLLFPDEPIPFVWISQETDVLNIAGRQLQDYLSGRIKDFTVPLAPSGSATMLRIWDQILAIPHGQTRSYQAVAAEIGNAKAARVVGQACKRNPIPIFIPCHRVIGANGRLTGYRGGLALKIRLLELEQH